MRPAASLPSSQLGAHQPLEKILEARFLVGTIAHGQLLARRINRATRVQPRREHAQIDVREKRAEQNHAITRLDIAAHFLAAHRALINAQIKWMLLANNGFAQQRRGYGNVRLFRELQQFLLQAEAVQFHVRDDHRLPRGVDHFHRVRQRRLERKRIAGFHHSARLIMRVSRHRHHVTRQFDVAGPLVTQHCVDDPVNFLKCRLRIVQHRRGHSELFEYFLLRVEIADLVVQQRILFALLNTGRAADDNDRRLFRERPRNRIGHLQSAHAIRDAHCPQPLHARVSICRKARALLVAGVDGLERAVQQLLVKAQHVIAGDAEDMAHPVRVQALNQIFADRGGFFGSHENPSRKLCRWRMKDSRRI